MRLIVQKDYETMSTWAAYYVARAIIKAEPKQNSPFVLGLPTGSTPLGMYRILTDLYNQGVISFRHVVTFNMDEYVGIPSDHPQSYRRFMQDNFFSSIDIPKENINFLDGNAPDPDEECRRYEQAIDSYEGIDLFLGGIGTDGHLAFNEPGSSLTSRTRVKTLAEETRVSNSRFFDHDISKVPQYALTVGVGTIMDAREVLILAYGHSKARALKHVIEEGVNHMWTVSALQQHRRATILCDEDATDELTVGTVKYFKQMEAPNLDPDKLLDSVRR